MIKQPNSYEGKNMSSHAALKALIARLPTGTTPRYLEIQKLIASLSPVVEHIHGLQTNPSELLSRLAVDREIISTRLALGRLIPEIKAQIDALIAEERSELDATNVEAAGLKTDDFAAETRQVFRALTQSEKLSFLADALKDNDGATMGAILQAPLHLSGLTAEMRADYHSAFLAKTAPVGKQKFLDSVAQTTDVIFKTAITV
jgi:hypothetical protein